MRECPGNVGAFGTGGVRVRLRLLLALAAVAAALGAAPAIAQAQPEIQLYQCRNGERLAPVRDCRGSISPYGWASGSANDSNSLYREGDSGSAMTP